MEIMNEVQNYWCCSNGYITWHQDEPLQVSYMTYSTSQLEFSYS